MSKILLDISQVIFKLDTIIASRTVLEEFFLQPSDTSDFDGFATFWIYIGKMYLEPNDELGYLAS